MPLDREHVTLGQRVMVNVNGVFAFGLGFGYTFLSKQLEQQPTYRSAAELLPLPYQGIGFLAIAFLMAVGMISHNRGIYIAGLIWMMVWLFIWALILVRAAHSGQASVLAAWWPAYVVLACWASAISLISREH